MARRLQLLRRSLRSDEFNSALTRLLELTGETVAGEMAIYRVVALTNRYWQLSSDDRVLHAGLLDEIMELAERFPSLRRDRIFIKGLRDFCQIAQDDGYVEIRRRIEREYEELMAASETPDEIRRYALGQIAPYFLTLIDSPEELARRMEMYQSMLELPEPEQFVFVTNQPYFLEEIGHLDEAITVIEKTLPQLKARGMMRTHSNRTRQLLRARALLKGDLDEYIAGLRRMTEEALREGIGVPPFLGNELAFVGMMFGATEWWRGTIDEFPFDPEYLPAAARVMAPGALQPVATDSEIIEMLKEPIVRTEQLLALRAAEARIRSGSGAFEPEREPISDAVRGALDWLSERRLDALMASFSNAFQDYLPPKQREAYRKRAAQVAAEREAEEGARRGDGRLMVTMLGKIEVQVAGSDAEPLQPRGARQKSFLGAMVACEMLAKPLERDEFLEAAGIENDDPKLARDAVNSALYRLREVVGRDAIRMAGEIPRLNLDLVRVDLIDAHNLFREAAGAVRHGALARAGLSTLKALDITRGDVPFPALYKSLFEAMREDFENLSRTTIIDVARRLLRESDAASAVQLLERAFAIMPDDEDIAALYPEALEAAGNRVEAERVRRRAEAAV
jgi:DNA-binding SARP family transcriptional activator